MDHKFTENLRLWLETPKDERDLEQGATYFLQLSGNKIMYMNLMRNLKRYANDIEYQLQKYYNYRVKDLTHHQVEEMEEKVRQIVANHFSYLDTTVSPSSGDESSTDVSPSTPSSGDESPSDASPSPSEGSTSISPSTPSSGDESPSDSDSSSSYQKGKRQDHDSLPLDIQSLYVENLSIMQKMRELHLQLRMLSTENATCPDSERYPFLKELIDLDTKYHHNWDIYDHYIIGQTETESTPVTTDPAEESKSALRLVNLMKGKYKKNPTDELKEKILTAYSKILEPSDKLTSELKELGIL